MEHTSRFILTNNAIPNSNYNRRFIPTSQMPTDIVPTDVVPAIVGTNTILTTLYEYRSFIRIFQ